ncbi:HAD-IA family hydrolase [Streptomyces sp. DSM 40750]|uniref:HAD-IA family hydrolase n=1 Tax=Streptomyces sp. DSM 40750 TaxID=2801030 RepID=UPI00214AFFB7|nr:HAD-IA family hydrolase [Streptomyces sp. DSM 40750]UUU22357.1 HAD-IA family hydrolase [Streptomyces sp. DSM 40750]
MSAVRSAVRAVWSDFGGVLTPPVGRDLEDFCARENIPAPAFREAMAEVARPFGGDIMAPLDTPLLSEEEWAARMAAELKRGTGLDVDLSGFGDRWFEGRRTNHAWLGFLREAHDAGVFVGLLSNMPPAWDHQWRRMIRPDGLFDELILSFQVGARKPERKIFELAAEAAGVPAHECVLVDDIAANCAGAEAAGWRSVHFTGAEEAAALLRPLLALPSPRV